MTTGPAAFETVQGFIGSWFGRALLLGWSYALFYHLANGIRHLAWDAGWGFELKTVYLPGWTVIWASVVLTLLAWILGYGRGGGWGEMGRRSGPVGQWDIGGRGRIQEILQGRHGQQRRVEANQAQRGAEMR